MSNRIGGRYDRGGNWSACNYGPTRRREIWRAIFDYTAVAALIIGLGAFLHWTWTRHDAPNHDEPATYYDPSRSGWTR